MKTIKKINILMVCFLALLATACGKETPFGFDTDTEEYGEVSMRKMLVSINNDEQTRADVSSFLVDIWQGSKLVKSYVYADMPEVITLPVGDYTVKVRSHEVEPAAWDKPYYEGSQDFTVEARKITDVETVVCYLANVRVTVLFDEKLKAAMSADSKVSVVVADDEILEFTTATEKSSGYFKYVEGSRTMVATFTGMVDGGAYPESLKTYEDVAPGKHYKILYKYHEGGVTDPEGNVTQGIMVDAVVEVVDMNINVDPGEDTILPDDKRPSESDPEDPGTGDDPVTPSTGPSVTADAPIQLGKVNYVTDSSVVRLNITSDAAGGFTTFKVKIQSPTLTDEVLEGVGLLSTLDLINPVGKTVTDANYPVGTEINYGDALTNDLGLPCYVGGQSSVVFDITSFIPLLGVYGSAEHHFILTVGDANGTNTVDLILQN